MKKRWITIFPDLANVHLYKDVGAIPYFLAEKEDWDCSILYIKENSPVQDECYENKVNIVPLKLSKGEKKFFKILNFISKYAKEYNVVNLYHNTTTSVLYALLFRLFNPRVKVYIKLDMDNRNVISIKENRKKLSYKILHYMKYLISKVAVDIYSIESKEIYDVLVQDYYFKDRLEIIPNGFALDNQLNKGGNFDEKENVILTVGRLGSEQKYNELLIDAISMLDERLIKNWKVYLVGPIADSSIIQYVEEIVDRKPSLKNTFIFTGNVSDKKELYDIYRRAKIFCLTSKWEGFALVLPEAMYFSNYMICTDLPSTRYITKDGSIGALFPVGDSNKLANLIEEAISGKINLEEKGYESQRYVEKNFNWRTIVDLVTDKLKSYGIN